MIRDEKHSHKSDGREMKENREKCGDMEIDGGGHSQRDNVEHRLTFTCLNFPMHQSQEHSMG